MDGREVEREFKDLLEEAIKEPGILSECYRQFHSYSLANLCEIYLQSMAMGVAFGPAAGMKKWNEKGRTVKKGQRKIWIWFPVMKRYQKVVKDANGEPVLDANGEPKTETVSFCSGFSYKPGVFVISQTEGKDVEFPETPEWDREQAIENLGIKMVEFDYPDGNCQGFARKGNEVGINPVAAHPMRTLVHEIAHCLLGHTEEGVMSDTGDLTYGEAEMEAEGVAYLVSYAMGLDGAEESRGYIQNWAAGKGYTEKMAQRIFGTANKILQAGRV